MKIRDLENALQKIAHEVYESKLIQKCRFIAENEGVRTDVQYGIQLRSQPKNISLTYCIYKAGGEEVVVEFNEKEVFRAARGAANIHRPKQRLPLIKFTLDQKEELFDIQRYLKGNWESEINDCHLNLIKEVSAEELKFYKENFGIEESREEPDIRDARD